MADVFDSGSFTAKVRSSIMRLVDDPYDHEINQSFSKAALGNWYDVPGDFKGSMLAHVESGNIQVPVSQVVGQYVSADSVAGLGAKIHGRRGMVRAGTPPFNFVELVFDEVADKWVSAPVTVLTQRQALDSTSSTSYVDSTEATGTLLSWDEWSDAGLTMVFRYITAIQTTNGAHTASSTLQFTPYTVNGSNGTPVDSTDHQLTVTGTTNFTLKDSGWQAIPSSVTASDFLLIEARKKISNGAGTCNISGCTAWMRWVSS